jgi:hypothetical protein
MREKYCLIKVSDPTHYIMKDGKPCIRCCYGCPHIDSCHWKGLCHTRETCLLRISAREMVLCSIDPEYREIIIAKRVKLL